MGMRPSARLTYGFDVTNQLGSGLVWYEECADEPGEGGSRILLAADASTPIRLAHDEYTGQTILCAAWEHADYEGSEIDSLELPSNAAGELGWAADILGFDLGEQKPVWRLTAKFD